jgi:hypothetical protein
MSQRARNMLFRFFARQPAKTLRARQRGETVIAERQFSVRPGALFETVSMRNRFCAQQIRSTASYLSAGGQYFSSFFARRAVRPSRPGDELCDWSLN